MGETVVLIGIFVLLAVGFYMTRGGGGVPGGIGDPAREQLSKYTQLGDPAPGIDDGERDESRDEE
jgi:hypothetical protein